MIYLLKINKFMTFQFDIIQIPMKSFRIRQLLLLLTIVNASEGQSTSHSSTAVVLIVVLLFVLSLIGCVLYDKNNNFRLLNSLRHGIGDLISKLRRHRKNSQQKQLKVETEQIMPTPKTNYVMEVDHERTYVDAEPKAILHQALCPPAIIEEEANDKNVDLKNVFQSRQSKHQKVKKSKSKLKNRLQSQASQSGQQKPEGQQNSSFTDDSQPQTTNPQPSPAPSLQE